MAGTIFGGAVASGMTQDVARSTAPVDWSWRPQKRAADSRPGAAKLATIRFIISWQQGYGTALRSKLRC